MEDGPPSFPQGFTCPVVLGILLGLVRISRTGLSPAVAGLSRPFRYPFESHVGVPQPRKESLPFGLGIVPVRSPLLRESRLIYFPPGTEMFQFPGFASYTYEFSAG